MGIGEVLASTRAVLELDVMAVDLESQLYEEPLGDMVLRTHKTLCDCLCAREMAVDLECLHDGRQRGTKDLGWK